MQGGAASTPSLPPVPPPHSEHACKGTTNPAPGHSDAPRRWANNTLNTHFSGQQHSPPPPRAPARWPAPHVCTALRWQPGAHAIHASRPAAPHSAWGLAGQCCPWQPDLRVRPPNRGPRLCMAPRERAGALPRAASPVGKRAPEEQKHATLLPDLTNKTQTHHPPRARLPAGWRCTCARPSGGNRGLIQGTCDPRVSTDNTPLCKRSPTKDLGSALSMTG